MKHVYFLTVFVFLLLSFTCFSQEKTKKPIEQKMEEKSKEKTKELTKKVRLTEKQSFEVEAIYLEYYKEKEALKLKIDAIEKEMKKLKLKRGMKLDEILNTEQKQQLELQKKKREKRKKKN